MANKIFANCRRSQDGGWAAEAIATRLKAEFGVYGVFLDVQNVRPSAKFAAEIRSEIAQAPAFIVVIGEDWHKIQDERTGNKRIAEDNDLVREEIRTTIERDIPIFILLLEAAELLDEGWLPKDIRPFLASQANQVRQANVDADLEPVLEQLTSIPRSRAHSSGRSRFRPSVQIEKPGTLLEGESAEKTSLVPSGCPSSSSLRRRAQGSRSRS
jgi:TIR domain-containing protein